MSYLRLFLLISMFALTFVGCRKDFLDGKCQKLKDAMVTNNVITAKVVITRFIDGLPSKKYTQENLSALAESLSAECSIRAEVLCFDCIKTLPSQSEITLSFFSSGSSVSRTIDISYSPDNRMRVVNMHE